MATKREEFEQMKGPALPYALYKAFRDAGVSMDDMWKLCEIHNAPLLRRAAAAIGTRRQLVGELHQGRDSLLPRYEEQHQPV